MSCSLSLKGIAFDPDSFLEKSKLQGPYRIRYKGEPRFHTKPDGAKIPFSLIGLTTSEADFDDLKQQIIDTIKYLEDNKEQLKFIAETPCIDEAVLNFGIDLKIDRKKVLLQSEVLPARLLLLAGELGLDIELSLYPPDLQLILERRRKKTRKKRPRY